MNPDPIQELRDTVLRRELDAEEERVVTEWLARHPEAVSGWRADLALARELRRLPEVELPADFTRRILAEISAPVGSGGERDRSKRRGWGWSWSWGWGSRRWIPALGFAVVLMAVGLGGWQWNVAQRRAELGQQLTALRTFSEVTPAVLEDFDAIRTYAAGSAPVDFGLLAAFE